MTPTPPEVESAERLVEQARLRWRNDNTGRKAQLFRDYIRAVANAVKIESSMCNEERAWPAS